MAVVTQPPKPVGRDKAITPSPVAIWAQKNKVLVLGQSPERLVQDLKKINADLGVLESYGEILSLEVINLFPHGIINVHPSLLPKYRGSSPNQAVILNGDQFSGITAIKLDSEMDHGPILAKLQHPVLPDDTFGSLRERLFAESAKLLIEILPKYLRGEISPTPQDDTQATYTWKTDQTKNKAYFDISSPPDPQTLDRMIRAFHPWPNSWTRWNGKIVKFFPGKLVQIEGKNKVTLEQFLRGYPNFPIKDLLSG